MQPPTVREVIRGLEQDGFTKVNQKGSHRQFKKGGKRVTVAGKMSDHLDWGTWKAIKQQAGW